MNRKLFLIALAIINIMFLIFWIANIILEKNTWNSFKSNAIETEAEIISIFTTHVRSGERHTVHIEYYDLENKKHTKQLDYYTKNMSEGSHVTIYYNKNYPDEFMSDPANKKSNRISWFTLILFIDVALLIIAFKKNNKDDYYY